MRETHLFQTIPITHNEIEYAVLSEHPLIYGSLQTDKINASHMKYKRKAFSTLFVLVYYSVFTAQFVCVSLDTGIFNKLKILF